MLRLLLVLALVAGLGSPEARTASPADPLALVGWWRVLATGETVVVDPSRFEVRRDQGASRQAGGRQDGGADADVVASGRTAEGSWVGDSAGRFLARVYGVRVGAIAPGWLGAAAGFGVDGADRVLVDRAGATVARLVPAPPGAATGAVDPARPPSDLERRAGTPTAPLPAGLRPAAEVTGRWVPTGAAGPRPSFVEFAADGTWTGSDGCTGTGGTWLSAPDGAFLATAWTVMTFVACPGVGVAPQVGAARRIGLDGPDLVLLGSDGTPVGHFHRS